MQIITNWENFTDEELKHLEANIAKEVQERKNSKKRKLIEKFTDALSELQKNGIDVYFEDVYVTKDYLSFDY